MRRVLFGALLGASCAVAAQTSSAPAPQPAQPSWMNRALSPDARADLLLKEMTADEKRLLVHSHMPAFMIGTRPPDALMSAGYVPGIARLGLPPMRMTDASLGVSNVLNGRKDDVAVALPSGLSNASAWDEQQAFAAGAMIGGEARTKGYDVMLAGGVNLVRDPRSGRNFEYLGEDPLLAGTLAGAAIRGIQSRHIVSTVKHFAINDQETSRMLYNARIEAAALRESDLLAFQIAIERGAPGSVMTAYNQINGEYGSENAALINGVLKTDWQFPGWVMSDWAAMHSTVKAVLAGQDQQSGQEIDKQPYFDAPLKKAIEAGEVPAARLDDMARRILRARFDKGVLDDPVPLTPGTPDYAADSEIAQRVAERGMVLLKNAGDLLPLAKNLKKLAVIGGHADIGVLSGSGSSQVRPVGGPALEVPLKTGPAVIFSRKTYDPSSPLKALQALMPQTQIVFDAGTDPAKAATTAKDADAVIVIAEQWMTEGEDLPSLALADDALIAAVAAANPRTVVVLENGSAVLMPWLAQVPAVLCAWYPGQRGGEALARVLLGEANPSGKLPISFPAAESQLPRAQVPGLRRMGSPPPPDTAPVSTAGWGESTKPFDVDYLEGADVGYRWYDAKKMEPLFPFGFGLSYTTFKYELLKLDGGDAPRVTLTVTNTGARAGADVVQLYVRPPSASARRLAGWARMELAPGASAPVTLGAEPRTLASFDAQNPGWAIAAGEYQIFVGSSSAAPLAGTVKLNARRLPP